VATLFGVDGGIESPNQSHFLQIFLDLNQIIIIKLPFLINIFTKPKVPVTNSKG